MVSTIIAIITSVIVYILVKCLAKPLLNQCLATMDKWIPVSFFIESQFSDISTISFDLQALTNAVFTYATAFLVLCFIVRLIQVYFSWSNRRSRNITYDSLTSVF